MIKMRSVQKVEYPLRFRDSELLLLFWLFQPFILTVVRFLLVRVGIVEGPLRAFIQCVVAALPVILFFLVIDQFRSDRYFSFFVLYATVIGAIVISAVFNPELIPFFQRENYGLDAVLRPDSAIYAFLFFSIEDDPSSIRKLLKLYASIEFVFLVIVELIPALIQGYWVDVGPNGEDIQLSYSLSFGYMMTLPTIVFMYAAYKEQKARYLLLSLVCLLCILTNGNRGALIIPLAYTAFMIALKVIGNDRLYKRIGKAINLTVIAGLLFFFRDYILQALGFVLQLTGIRSRSVTMLVQGTITNDNGRANIWNAVIEAIRTGGPFGYGVFGDRPFVAPIHYVGYSHNLFLELLVSFGIIGVLLILYLLLDILRMFLVCSDDDWKELYVLFLACSCQLILSESFWYVWEFWAAAAIAYKCRKMKL